MERASVKPVAYLHQMPRWLPPVVIAALFVAGISVRGWPGAALLAIVAALLGWLAFLSWPALHPGSRALRLVMTAALVGLALWQASR